jgi:hypothetical protein
MPVRGGGSCRPLPRRMPALAGGEGGGGRPSPSCRQHPHTGAKALPTLCRLQLLQGRAQAVGRTCVMLRSVWPRCWAEELSSALEEAVAGAASAGATPLPSGSASTGGR